MAEEKRLNSLNKPCVFLIVIAGVERFVFKGVGSNLVVYLTNVMQMSSSAATRAVSSWTGFTHIVPLLVAPLVDSYWDRYTTILATSCIYLIGLLALTLTTLLKSNSSSSMFLSLYLISLGIGGYKPSLQAFAVDQIDKEHYELSLIKTDKISSNEKGMFFQWWYFGVCIGSLMGVSIMPNIQDLVGWALGFGTSVVAMVVSMIMFLGCSRFYYSHDRAKSLEEAVKWFVSKILHLKIEEKSTVIELE